jgi:hypothetical protein
MARDNMTIIDIVRILAEGKNVTANIDCDIESTVFTSVTGIKATYNAVPLEKYLEAMPNFTKVDFDIKGNFTGFFQQYLQEKVPRDLAALKKIHPGLVDWRRWLLKIGWKGEPGLVQTTEYYYEKRSKILFLINIDS